MKTIEQTLLEDVEAHQKALMALSKERDNLKTENDRLRKALIKIKDGGVPNGVFANVTERMLVMCEIAEEALKGE